MIKDEKGNILATKVEYANTFFTRFLGLMGRKKENFPEGSALFFNQCNSIHMFFMKFPIDVIYLDKDFHVVRVVKNIQPWKVDKGSLKAQYGIELNANTIKEDPKIIYID